MIESAIDDMVNEFDYRLQMQGLSLDTYMQYTGMDVKAFREGYKANAEAQVKLQLAFEAIAKAENIEATEEEIEAEYDKLAKTYDMEVEQVKKAVASKSLAADIVSRKVADLIKAEAKISDEKATKKSAAKKKADDVETEEKPAKKPAAKKTTKKKADEE